jgi:hypothetical protein
MRVVRSHFLGLSATPSQRFSSLIKNSNRFHANSNHRFTMKLPTGCVMRDPNPFVYAVFFNMTRGVSVASAHMHGLYLDIANKKC